MSEPTSKLQRLRKAIKAILVRADLFTDDAVLAHRDADIWNAAAVAISAASNSMTVTISAEQGDGTEEDSLEMDLLIVVTLMAAITPTPDEEPEEVMWEALLEHLHNARPEYEGGPGDEYNFRLRFQGWRNAADLIPVEQAPAIQFARQATFRVRFSLEPKR